MSYSSSKGLQSSSVYLCDGTNPGHWQAAAKLRGWVNKFACLTFPSLPRVLSHSTYFNKDREPLMSLKQSFILVKHLDNNKGTTILRSLTRLVTHMSRLSHWRKGAPASFTQSSFHLFHPSLSSPLFPVVRAQHAFHDFSRCYPCRCVILYVRTRHWSCQLPRPVHTRSQPWRQLLL